ncbi:MAG: XkdF-like putative serine protease domain-containing protein [Desulfuromonadaceae bacterium]
MGDLTDVKLASVEGDKVQKCEGIACETEKFMPIVKVDYDEHKVFCVVAVPDEFDLQGDRSSRKEVEKAAHRFMERLQKFHGPGVGAFHRNAIDASIIENVVTQQDGVRLGDQVLKAGTWYQGHKVDEPAIWKGIKSGEISGLSRQGRGVRRPLSGLIKASEIAKSASPLTSYHELSDEELDRIDWVGKAANGRKIAIIKMLQESDSMETDKPAKGNGEAGAGEAQVTKAALDKAIQKAVDVEKKGREAAIAKAVKDAVDEEKKSHADAIAKEQAEKAELNKELAIEREARTDVGKGPVTKTALNEAIQKALTDERKGREEAIKKAVDDAIAKEQAEKKELKKELAIERDVRITKEYIEKATTDLPHLPGITPSLMGPVLKEAQEKLSETTFKGLYDVLKAASAVLGESAAIYKEIGSDMDLPKSGSAEAQLNALAATRAGEIRKSANGATLDPKVAKAIAYQQVLDENPALEVAHRKEYLKGGN